MITVRIPLTQPYSYIEATFDSIMEINESELYDLATRLDEAFPKPAFPQVYAHRNDADRAPEERMAAPRQRGRGTNLYCADHKVEVMKTAAKYDRDGDKYYHPLPESDWYVMSDGRIVKNCNTYERLLVGPSEL